MVLGLPTYLSIGGLTLDFFGAAFLAYDSIFGPKARREAAQRRDQLALASRTPSPRERGTGASSSSVIEGLLAEIEYWDRHERRAHVHGIIGLLLLMTGFLCQCLAALVAAIRSNSVTLPCFPWGS